MKGLRTATYTVRTKVFLLVAIFVVACTFPLVLLLRETVAGGGVFLTVDDAFIYVAMARNLAEGSLFAWAVDEPPVDAATSFLYYLLLAGIFAVLPVSGFESLVSTSVAVSLSLAILFCLVAQFS